MERKYRIAIVFGSWTFAIGLVIAFVLPVVASPLLLSSLNVEDSRTVMAKMMEIERLTRWSVIIGACTSLFGGTYVAIALSRWFMGRPDESTRNS